MKQTADLKVFISSRDSSCGECGEDLGRKAWITLVEDKGALLARGYDRWDARAQVEEEAGRVLAQWEARE